MPKLKPKFRPVMLSTEAHALIGETRDLAMRLGLDRLPPSVRTVFESSSHMTRASTVEAAVALLYFTLRKEDAKQ